MDPFLSAFCGADASDSDIDMQRVGVLYKQLRFPEIRTMLKTSESHKNETLVSLMIAKCEFAVGNFKECAALSDEIRGKFEKDASLGPHKAMVARQLTATMNKAKIQLANV